MSKVEWGKKIVCSSCGARFYDLNRKYPLACPICGSKIEKISLDESSSEISIEESIFIEKGSKIQQNKQIVITGFVGQSKKIEHWSFKSS